MVQKRMVLEQLSRDELLSMVDLFGLEIADKKKRNLVEAIAAARKARLGDWLPTAPRDRLKELCRAVGLDDGGREKTALIERLIGAAPGEPKSAPPPAGRVEVAPGDKLTLPKLEAHLWSAADILRGSIDSSDYKGFIFGLLFLKRLSDRFEEECDALQDVPGADLEDPDEHDFFVPKRARWSEIQKAATNIGEVLNKAAADLEDSNSQTLEGVLSGIDFTTSGSSATTRAGTTSSRASCSISPR